MPQLTLEYTENLPPPADLAGMLESIHQVLHQVGGINIANCKSRVRGSDTFYIANGEEDGAFLHLDIRLLEGRSSAVKQAIGEQVLDILKQEFSHAEKAFDLQITVEIRDISRDSYFKHPPGTFTNQSRQTH